MKGCQTNIEFLFTYHATKADGSTDFVWLDTIFFSSQHNFLCTKLYISEVYRTISAMGNKPLRFIRQTLNRNVYKILTLDT